jgi:NAD(P)-dependent dehydrogenase (short-subunit alcohol dehydrogenase family)
MRLGEEALQELEDGGAMVLLSSTLAERPIATSAVYSATKAGLQAMGKVLAAQGAQRSLRVNSLCLGVVETPMVSGDAARLAAVEKLHPLGLGKPSDVASAIVWLLGAPWMTGSEILLDGGLLLPQWNRP